jgi:cell division protein FtsI (penicillin-binding protein 3)
VAFAKLADQFYHNQPEKFTEHLHKLRLDMPTGIDITASSGNPIIYKPTSKYWHATSIPYMAHGYGELITPLHMLMVYNAVANNGKMMRPYLVSAIEDYGVVVKNIQPQVLEESICSAETLVQLKECLKAVVDSVHGTAHKVLFDSTYSIAGKTGTAVTALNNKGYNKGNKIYQASFIGYFPAESPKYTMAVVIQNSNESKLIYGADVSGRVFKEISDRIYNHSLSTASLNLPQTPDTLLYKYYGNRNDLKSIFNYLNMASIDSASSGYWRTLKLQNNNASLNMQVSDSASVTYITADRVTPNVAGMGLKDAVYLLENKGFVTSVSGRGRVVNQSIAAGQAFKKGQRIALVLN